MIGSCPSSWKDAETARACMSTNYTADPAVILPLLDVIKNVTYANIYCAMCHGKSRDLRYWSLQIWKGPGPVNISLQDVSSAEARWEALRVGEVIPAKCIRTSPEASSGPDTAVKRLCRSYANRISVEFNRKLNFKNPHCALLSTPDFLANCNARIKCGTILTSFPPRLSNMLFVFSARAKNSTGLGPLVEHVKYHCEINEVYDPFRERCLPGHFSHTHSSSGNTNITHKVFASHPKNFVCLVTIPFSLFLTDSFTRTTATSWQIRR